MTCPSCPDGSPCSHSIQCNCETYFKLRFCSHLHVIIASHGGRDTEDAEGEAAEAEEAEDEMEAEGEAQRRTASFKRKQMRRRRQMLQKAKWVGKREYM